MQVHVVGKGENDGNVTSILPLFLEKIFSILSNLLPHNADFNMGNEAILKILQERENACNKAFNKRAMMALYRSTG